MSKKFIKRGQTELWVFPVINEETWAGVKTEIS